MRSLSGTWILAFLASTISLIFFPCRPTAAFHSGGTGDCGGCHSMHNSLEGKPIHTSSSPPILLIGSDPGSTCLFCHQKTVGALQSAHSVATADADMPEGVPPGQLTPGGDFGWLKKSYRWDVSGDATGGHSSGERHGHNIIAADYDFVADSTLTEAPGGTYPARNLSCISCHDPHGKYRRGSSGSISTTGNPILASGSYTSSPDPDEKIDVGVYRILGGIGYKPKSIETLSFTDNPPAAVCPSDYNRPEDKADTRVAYGSGMSEWCANCHVDFLSNIGGKQIHPAGKNIKFSAEVAANYNAYVASGDLSGHRATAYSSMVPFEMGTSEYTLLRKTANSDGSVATGPDTGANVMCLSCHRAHASGWDKSARWNMKTEMLVWDGEYPGRERGEIPARYSQGRTILEIKRTFYDRPANSYAAFQRSLCNKCHAKD